MLSFCIHCGLHSIGTAAKTLPDGRIGCGRSKACQWAAEGRDNITRLRCYPGFGVGLSGGAKEWPPIKRLIANRFLKLLLAKLGSAAQEIRFAILSCPPRRSESHPKATKPQQATATDLVA